MLWITFLTTQVWNHWSSLSCAIGDFWYILQWILLKSVAISELNATVFNMPNLPCGNKWRSGTLLEHTLNSQKWAHTFLWTSLSETLGNNTALQQPRLPWERFPLHCRDLLSSRHKRICEVSRWCLTITPGSQSVFQLKGSVLMSQFFQKVMKGLGDRIQILNIKLGLHKFPNPCFVCRVLWRKLKRT